MCSWGRSQKSTQDPLVSSKYPTKAYILLFCHHFFLPYAALNHKQSQSLPANSLNHSMKNNHQCHISEPSSVNLGFAEETSLNNSMQSLLKPLKAKVIQKKHENTWKHSQDTQQISQTQTPFFSTFLTPAARDWLLWP